MSSNRFSFSRSNRRELLRAGMFGVCATAGAALPIPAFGQAAAALAAKGQAQGKILVVLELSGGNDGLNTVIPYADAQYAVLRPRLAIARDQVLQLDEFSGFNPALSALMPLWKAGELAVVQGVGYPSANLSHFRSIEIWDTASKSDEFLQNGWLARAFAAAPVPRGFAADAVVVGSAEMEIGRASCRERV